MKPQETTNTSKNRAEPLNNWLVYIVRCSDGSLYTGVTTDLQRRVRQHNGEIAGGARYTRGRRPVVLVYQESCPDQASATRREARIKRLPTSSKNLLLELS